MGSLLDVVELDTSETESLRLRFVFDAEPQPVLVEQIDDLVDAWVLLGNYGAFGQGLVHDRMDLTGWTEGQHFVLKTSLDLGGGGEEALAVLLN